MLVCRACNTRFDAGMTACPSCGRRAADHAADAGASGSGLLPQATPVDQDAEIDLELEDAVGDESPPKAAERPDGEPERKRTATPSAMKADAEQVRKILAEQPGLLEKGLGLHADEDGEPLGIDFPTPVGSIDVLARDRKGCFVVVHVPAPDEVADSVSGMLRRMGWVRKHRANREEVRGVVVLEQLPEELSYAAAGAGGAISFKGFRFALTFHDLDT